MFHPSNRTTPSTWAPGTVSCIRLRQRRSVDLPQPDGPMMAVTCPLPTLNETSRTALTAPNVAESDSVAMDAGGPASVSIVVAIGTTRSIAAGTEPGPRGEARRDADDQDEANEDE